MQSKYNRSSYMKVAGITFSVWEKDGTVHLHSQDYGINVSLFIERVEGIALTQQVLGEIAQKWDCTPGEVALKARALKSAATKREKREEKVLVMTQDEYEQYYAHKVHARK